MGTAVGCGVAVGKGVGVAVGSGLGVLVGGTAVLVGGAVGCAATVRESAASRASVAGDWCMTATSKVPQPGKRIPNTKHIPGNIVHTRNLLQHQLIIRTYLSLSEKFPVIDYQRTLSQIDR